MLESVEKHWRRATASLVVFLVGGYLGFISGLIAHDSVESWLTRSIDWSITCTSADGMTPTPCPDIEPDAWRYANPLPGVPPTG